MNRNRQIKKICAAGLTAALAVGIGVSGFSYTHTGKTPASYTSTTNTVKAGNSAKTVEATSDKELFKEEAVYVLADPSGAVSDITVADWLKNAGGLGSLTDSSTLSDVVNTKGDETFTQSGEALTWQTKDSDIYYQGKATKELPVGVEFTYKLDGTEMKPEELAGKSGALEIQIHYTNNSKMTESLSGKETELYTPFLMATALMLPTDIFTNVQVDNGKMVSDGDKVVVLGYGMPGLQDSLDAKDNKDITIPDTVTLTANVKDFTMGSTLTYASTDLLNDIDIDNIDSFDKLKDSMNDLRDASNQLVDGCDALAAGVKQLKDKSGEFTSGIDALTNGLKEFATGASSLKTGLGDYTDGVNELVGGLNSYVTGSKTFNKGVTDYTNGADKLISGVNTLSSSLSDLPESISKLSSGYTSVMDGFDQLASNDNMNALTNGASSLSSGITSANGGLTQIQGGVTTVNNTLAQLEASFSNNQKCIDALNASLDAMPDGASKTQLQSVIANLTTVTATQKQTIAQLKAATSENSTLGKGLESLVTTTGTKGDLKKGAEQLKSGLKNFDAGAAKIKGAFPQLRAGTKKLSTAVNKLPASLKQLTTGASDLGKNSKTLRTAAKTLDANSSKLTAGGKTLKSNNNALLSGAAKLDLASQQLLAGGKELSSGGVQLSDGINDLYDGSVKLQSGMKEFNQDGIQTLYKTVNTDLQNILDRLKALQKLGTQYQSFSGKSDDMNGSVKFIIKTDEIKNETSDSAE